MNSILNIKSKGNLYNDNSFLGRIKDRFKITYEGEFLIRDLNLSIINMKIPSNIYPKSYDNNIKIAKKIARNNTLGVSPDIWRMMDYYRFNEYQKKLFAFSVVQSIKVFFRLNSMNISTSCVAIIDAVDDINKYIIEELCKVCSNVVLYSQNIKKLINKREYLIYNYGVTPIITRDYDYLIKNSDFIISSRDIDPNNNKCNIWYINNRYIPNNKHNLDINDLVFKVPWKDMNLKYNVQILGAILNCIGGKDIEQDLKTYDIQIERYEFVNN